MLQPESILQAVDALVGMDSGRKRHLNLEPDDQPDCDWTYFSLEMLAYLPVLVYFVTGTINFYKIRSIGFNRVVQFSQLFKAKLRAVQLVAALNAVEVPLAYWGYSEKGRNNHMQLCIDHLKPEPSDSTAASVLPFLKLLNVLGWTGCYYLLIYEYRKGLSENWLAHKLLWTMNLVVILLDTIYAGVCAYTTPGMIVI